MVQTDPTQTMYHVSPEKGPGKCGAKVGRCPFGSLDKHYNDPQVAMNKWQGDLTEKYGEFGTMKAKRMSASPVFQKMRKSYSKSNPDSPLYNKTYARFAAARAAVVNRPTEGSMSAKTIKASQGAAQRPSRVARRLSGPMTARTAKFLKKQDAKLTKSLTPNSAKVKKLMLTKYWMPDPKSNAWKN